MDQGGRLYAREGLVLPCIGESMLYFGPCRRAPLFYIRLESNPSHRPHLSPDLQTGTGTTGEINEEVITHSGRYACGLVERLR